MPYHGLAGRCQRYATLVPGEQRCIQLLLQGTDLCAEWWLRDPNAECSAGEAELLGYGQEVAKLSEVHG
jgi:hypothetical protein